MRHSATILLNNLLPQLDYVIYFVTNLSVGWNLATEAMPSVLMSGNINAE
jgi:hypothetical protein